MAAVEFDDLFGGDFDELDGLEKAAVIPPGGGDPAAMGGAPPMDPGMATGAPPADPSMAAGGAPPPMDPALQAAAPDAAMQQMVQQAVQQQMGQQGASPGAAGVAGKPAKPDVAVELQKMNEQIYKIGMGVTVLFNHMGIELPPAMMFGAPPATLDPALQAAAATPGAGLGDPAGGGMPPAQAPDGGGAKVAFDDSLDAAFDDDDAKVAFDDSFDFGKVAEEIATLADVGRDMVAAPGPAPSLVGSSYPGDPDVFRAGAPLSWAADIRRRAIGR